MKKASLRFLIRFNDDSWQWLTFFALSRPMLILFLLSCHKKLGRQKLDNDTDVFAHDSLFYTKFYFTLYHYRIYGKQSIKRRNMAQKTLNWRPTQSRIVL